MDFTMFRYRVLLSALQEAKYQFCTFKEYLNSKDTVQAKTVIMRHDVDGSAERALVLAEIEQEMGIRSTYYFRAIPSSWNEAIIKQISAMGHEVGYHYECLTTCRGDRIAAYRDFCKNLESLRKIAPVETICMHGSASSPHDSKDLWKHYSYKELGIIGEPYFDIDFSRMFYLTDTGRRWDGYKVSVRDKIESMQDSWEQQGLVFHTTKDIIHSIQEGRFPEQVMFTAHPDRWCNFGIGWMKNLVIQAIKNPIKRMVIHFRKRKK